MQIFHIKMEKGLIAKYILCVMLFIDFTYHISLIIL